MNDSGDQQQQRTGSSVNPKIASDSGYGSNKSTQRSSGSSKSHESSVSSESSTAYPPHPDAPVSITECQSHSALSPSQGGGTKRQGKKKNRKPSISEKPEGTLPQSMDQSGTSNIGASSNLPSGSHSQQQSSQIMSPGSKTSSTHDSKALQMAALTHALSCMKKFHKPLTDSGINEENEEMGTTSGKNWQEYFSNDIKVDDSGNEDTFASVVSLEDGIIVYITPTISSILGFPKDMLVGRSFIDFVHPKDRMAFASHITCGMSFPMNEQHSPQNQQQGSTNTPTGPARVKSEPFYCRLRQYRGLKTVGFGVVDKTVVYCPFKLSMTLKKVEQPQKQEVGGGGGAHSNGSKRGGGGGANELSSSQKDGNRNEEDASNKAPCPTSVHLVILANRIKSAYQYSDEIPSTPGKFVTRHSASCHFGHMDSEAISYLGHLPQDLIGNSVLDYYHPDDMVLMKDIYEGVMQEQGKPFRSKPYRFRVYNGTFAMLETDWSCFINPWSWKLEFVIGQHRVIKGPGNPNVFMQPTDDKDTGKSTEPEETLGESKETQNEIKRLLTETVTRRLSDPLRQQSSRRRKGLAALMESLLEGMAKPENSDKSGSQCSGMLSVMERDSVMLGEISPHHDDQSGSNQSSETPPSYNQLNYRENIERFFQSQPKTVRSDESAETEASTKQQKSNPSANRSSDSDSKSSPNIDYSSGSNANVRLSSGSEGNEIESGNMTCASPLTEERLSRHNEAMEKYMIQRHRELRGKSSMTPGSHKESRHKHSEKVYTPFVASSTSLSNDYDKCSYYIKLARCQRRSKCKHRATVETSHGLKRTGNASWDGDNTHTAKQPHLECLPGRNPTLPVAAPPGICCAGHGHNSINLWPPFSITTTPGVTTSTYRSAGGTGTGASYPTTFPGLSQCFNPNPPGRGGHAVAPGKLVPDTISMSATTPSAPLLFLPSHHHAHPHQQFVAQQVQLFPAGVVYQPVGSCVYGQPSPIMMPASFLGTMLHPDQSANLINQMESSVASQGEAIGTATLPKLPEKHKNGLSSTRCSYNMKTNTNYKQGFSARGTPVTATAGHMGGGGNGRSVNLGTINLPSASACLLNSNLIIGNEGSGSEESMNSSFMNTEDKDVSQSNSDADQDIQLWGNRRQEGDQPSGGTNNNASGTPRPVRNKQPPWLEKVDMTSDLMYRYRIPAGDLSDVLQKDLEALKIFGKQSTMVNDQLGMLYSELKLEGSSGIALNLEEGTTSNSSSGDENYSKEAYSEPRKAKKPVSSHQYSKMVILYEENAPFPPDSKISLQKSEAEV